MFEKSSVKTLIPFIASSIFIFLVLIIVAQGHASTSAASVSFIFLALKWVCNEIIAIVSQIGLPAESSYNYKKIFLLKVAAAARHFHQRDGLINNMFTVPTCEFKRALCHTLRQSTCINHFFYSNRLSSVPLGFSIRACGWFARVI